MPDSSDRSAQIAAARRLLVRDGFSRVAVADILEATGLSTSAFYRRYGSKDGLLREVLTVDIPTLDHSLDSSAASLLELGQILVTFAMSHPEFGLLWEREIRHLRQADRSAVNRRLSTTRGLLESHIRNLRAELDVQACSQVASAAIGTLLSRSYHAPRCSRPAAHQALVDVVGAALRWSPEPVVSDESATRSALPRQSTREVLLGAAISKFASAGFDATSLEDVGREASMAAPSVYNHFSSKQDLLVEAIQRGSSLLWAETSRAFDVSFGPQECCERIVASYAAFCSSHAALVSILLAETMHLPDEARARALQSQRDYVEEWVALVLATEAMDEELARIRVHAALTMIRTLCGGRAGTDPRAAAALALQILLPATTRA